MITTKELAQIAGVSQSTISRSLANHPRISKTTRTRIQALARTHGYRPPRTRLPGTVTGIGIIWNAEKHQSHLDLYLNRLSNELINQIEQTHGCAVVLTDDNSERALAQITAVLETGMIKGMIIINNIYNEALEQILKQHQIPHVYTQYFSRPMKKSLNIIDVDHFTGGRLATEHLLSLGHRSIGTLTAAGSDFDDRTAGYLAALERRGIPPRPEQIIRTGLTYSDGYRAVAENWGHLHRCTALFAQTDLLGIAAINYLNDHGYSVPGTYSVIGFDGLTEGLYCRPQLSTVIQPFHDIAKRTVGRLTQLMEWAEADSTHSFIHPRLQLRASTAAPRR